ncbi:hypothetical protein [Candidatus Nitrospira salsa]
MFSFPLTMCGNRWKLWTVPLIIAVYGLLLPSCATVEGQAEMSEEGEPSIVFGRIEVNEIGPNPRQFPARVRFVDVVHVPTQDWTRIKINPTSQTFAVSLSPGRYEMTRLQVTEGPFTAQSYLSGTFNIAANDVTYLGTWQLNVDTPRTQRMITFDVSDGSLNWDEVFENYPAMKGKSVVNAFPKLVENQARLYAVAPNPKLKYFYRQ